MKVICLIVLFASLFGKLQGQSAEMKKLIDHCKEKNPLKCPTVGIAKFAESARITDATMGGITIANRIITHIRPVKCFHTDEKLAHFVPEGAQAIITGDIKDYYTSEKALGIPRLDFLVELRDAITLKVIDTCRVNLKGKLYKGFGKNNSLEELWQKSLDSVAFFLAKHVDRVTNLKRAGNEKVVIGDKVLQFSQRVETEGPLQSQQTYNEKMRERNRNWALNKSTYYNDTVVYNEFPRIAANQFLEYTVDGKKYQFYDNSKDMDKMARFSSIEGLNFTQEGVRINIKPTTVAQEITFQLFYPADYPATRRFHFGSDTTYDERVPSGTPKVSFIASLLGNFKPAIVNRIAGDEYEAYASNKEKAAEMMNVDRGYLQVLHFETGNFGVVECYFKLHTKPGKTKAGKTIPAHTIEGRFRCRGKFRARGL